MCSGGATVRSETLGQAKLITEYILALGFHPMEAASLARVTATFSNRQNRTFSWLRMVLKHRIMLHNPYSYVT